MKKRTCHWLLVRVSAAVVLALAYMTGSVLAAPEDRNAALREAADRGDAKTVARLLKEGADINNRDGSGNSALSFAAFGGRTEVVKLLLTKGAEVNLPNNDGATPLIQAVLQNHFETTKLLLDKKANVNPANVKYGFTPLLVACTQGDVRLVQLLLDRGADLTARAESDFSALMLAARNGKMDVVKLLLARGADAGAQNAFGNTALTLAEAEGHAEVAELPILSCCQDEIIDPVESRYTCYFLLGLFQRLESIDEDTFDCVEALKDLVWKPFLADLFPEVLYGIKFRAVGWQENDPHVLGNLGVLGSVPSGFVHCHEDEIVGMAQRHLREKQRHGVRIDNREDQRIQNAISR